MEVGDIFDYPIFRLLWFLAFAGIFFYRDFPKPEWKRYLGLPLYWLFILFFGYFGISGMMAAGMSEIFGKFTDSGTVHSDLADQLTITSLCLLFLYRLFSRYMPHDESTLWAEGFIKGIVTSYIAFNLLFYAFMGYLSVDKAPKLEAFSGTLVAYLVLLGVFFADFVLWFMRQKSD